MSFGVFIIIAKKLILNGILSFIYILLTNSSSYYFLVIYKVEIVLFCPCSYNFIICLWIHQKYDDSLKYFVSERQESKYVHGNKSHRLCWANTLVEIVLNFTNSFLYRLICLQLKGSEKNMQVIENKFMVWDKCNMEEEIRCWKHQIIRLVI